MDDVVFGSCFSLLEFPWCGDFDRKRGRAECLTVLVLLEQRAGESIHVKHCTISFTSCRIDELMSGCVSICRDGR
jgi:hypothetical protein